MTRKQLRDFLVFWERLPDRALPPGSAMDAWKDTLRDRIRHIPPELVPDMIEIWRRRYEQTEADRVSSAARATALLTLIGVVTAASTLIISATSGAPLPFLVLVLAFGLLLLIAITAAVWLAIWVQQVGNWDSPRIEPEAASSARALRLSSALEHLAAAEQNLKRINNITGYLRDAQGWALVAISLLVILAPLAVAASLSKPTQPLVTDRLGQESGSPRPDPNSTSVPLTPATPTTPTTPQSSTDPMFPSSPPPTP